MNPRMFQQYRQKKKRPVDPNAPPRPTLLGHEKVIKTYGTDLESQKRQIMDMQMEMDRLRKKVSGLEQTVNQLIGILRRK